MGKAFSPLPRGEGHSEEARSSETFKRSGLSAYKGALCREPGLSCTFSQMTTSSHGVRLRGREDGPETEKATITGVYTKSSKSEGTALQRTEASKAKLMSWWLV